MRSRSSPRCSRLIPAILTTPKGENWLEMFQLKHPFLLHVRGIAGTVGNLCIIYAFVTIPLAEAYSLAFLAPIFIVVLSVWLLKEKVSMPRWLLLAASFVGVLIVVRPGFREIHPGHIAAIVSAMCGAASTSILRHIAKDEKRISLIGIPTVYILVLNIILIFWLGGGFNTPTLEEWALLGTIGALGGTANLLFIAATRSAPASFVAPIQYSQIFWAITFGAVFYFEYPDQFAYVGLAVIVIAGMFNVMSEETRIRFFSRLSPAGAGPSTLREATRPERATDVVLDGPIVGAAEAVTDPRN